MIKKEMPACSSSDGDEVEEPNKPVPTPMMSPRIQAKKKRAVKGLHICHLCGCDYMNAVDLNEYLMKHAGVTFTCECYGKTLPTQKAVNNHMRLHTKGPFICTKCKKNFALETTLRNHVKTHHLNPYLCDTDGCTWKTHSYVLHLEHSKYGHLNEKLFVRFWTTSTNCPPSYITMKTR